MKVYAKFRIDIDKEDESIYTQKAVNLMQKLGCKAEKLYSSMERYTFTVDIKEAVYRELVELEKEIDQVFQYDEDTEEDDDELLDIIEPDIWCSYIPKYTQEEEKNAIGYYIDLAGYEFEENEKKVYESLCPECETFFQNKEYTFKKKKQLEDLNRRKAVFTRPGQLDMFVTIPMYEYLIEKGLSQKNFIPAYYSGVLKKVAGYQLKAENVLTGAGSSAMIDMIGLTFLDEGDEVLFSAPTYGAFADMAYLNGGVPVSVPVTEEQKFNLPAMKEKIGEKTKIVVICNPNNPTGTYVPIGELEAFADTLPEDVLLVMDEAYMEFATEPDCCSMVDYMKAHPEKPILVLRTFSKYYAMAGLRVGYALGSEELIGIMRKCSASWNLNVCAQKAAVAGLADQEYYQEQKAKIVEGREYLEKEMAALGCRVYPSQSNFIYFDTGKDPAWIQEQLMEKGIRIGAFEMSRVSVGTMEECKLYIKALKEILEVAE